MNNKLDNFKKIKESNVIAIGGMIAAGKTTLVEELSKKLNAKVLLELDDNDEIQKALLKGLYERNNIAASVFQLYFFLRRFDNYQVITNEENITIVDRTIFEDRLFAHQNMANDPIVFSFYDKMWSDKVSELVYSVGVPKLYVILKIDWDLFIERLFKRNRKVEIDNFKLNELYFRSLNDVYVDFLEKTCKVYGINYVILDASIETQKKISIILEKLKQL